ncbi:hypothetical protein [Kineococcus sp. SYSU DK002]|uniref:hypothetical protein n=1 Tax=Kineococcus sp. SYSU DK002 TaxID=3383123 RepID=UPI003D7CD156
MPPGPRRPRVWPWLLLGIGGALAAGYVVDALGGPWWVRGLLTGLLLGTAGARAGRVLRARALRSVHGDTAFDAGVRSLASPSGGISRSWGALGAAVVTGDGTLRWRGRELRGGRLAPGGSRPARGAELLWLSPGWRVWTVEFDGGLRAEIALDPSRADRLAPWGAP